MFDLIIIGGGAAGIFAAISAKTANPSASVLVLEKSASLLAKVRVSGGGRCNVTNSCFDPKALVKNYPRGSKELLGPFHRFGPTDTVSFFATRGVPLKTEADGRMFPKSDSSETIINCLLFEAKKLGVEIRLKQKIISITKRLDALVPSGTFEVLQAHDHEQGVILEGRSLLLATGSSAEGHRWAVELGHTIQKPIPSLFTFNVPTSPLKELSGISTQDAELRFEGASFSQRGPLLITHFGFSGPAAIKLSAWAARFLYENDYKAKLIINWVPELSEEQLFLKFSELKKMASHKTKTLLGENPFGFTKGLWKALLKHSNSDVSQLKNSDLQTLSKKLNHDCYMVNGKTTHKEEFVTCGGVSLKEVDFKTMQSRTCARLYFAGEILDIDGVTGGFNFQNAWTTGLISGQSSIS